jgi:SAM-dependent methyltransferase
MLTDTDKLAAITFTIDWESEIAHHTDQYHGQRINFWRDCFPKSLGAELLNRFPGDAIDKAFSPGEIVPPFNPKQEFSIQSNQFSTKGSDGPIHPRQGRFYPKGLLKGIANVFPQNIEPFRVLSLEKEKIHVSFNHPLASTPLQFRAEITEVIPKPADRGGTCIDWMETLTSGPGMQARASGRPTDFFADDPFRREDETDDGLFYGKPRLVQHLDDRAILEIRRLYEKLLPKNADVLDLMSSWTSHLPDGLPLGTITGLGMNAEELERNPRLNRRIVHDLNRDPKLPFSENAFDAIICTASVEYLIHPFAVFEELARVLKPGGICIMTVSNRWFPPKAIRIWKDLHEFERMGLILEYFLSTGKFGDLHSHSLRGLPRPETDKYFGSQRHSDPVYAVWGIRNPH